MFYRLLFILNLLVIHSFSAAVGACCWELAAGLLDNLAREVDTCLDTFIEIFVLVELGEEAADERVSGTISIHNFICLDWCDWVLFDLIVS